MYKGCIESFFSNVNNIFIILYQGTKEELWTQLQRCRVEKKVFEQKVNTLEREIISFKSKTQSLERTVHEEKLLNTSLKQENENLNKKTKEQEDEISELHELSSHTNVLGMV